MMNPGKKKASIFIIVLWVLCLLTVFAVSLSQIVRQKLSLSARLEQKDKLHYIAQAGVRKAIFRVIQEESKTYYAFMDNLANNPSDFSNVQVGNGLFNVSYEYPDDITKSMIIKYGLIDEERKININKADDLTLKRLFTIVLGIEDAQAKDLANSFLNWRAPAGQPANVSEDSYYTGLTHPYKAKHADLEVPDEILLVRGVNQDAWEKLKNYVTIYGDGKVNINTASRSVLLAIGLNDDIAEMIIEFRAGDDRQLGTADDKVFDTASNIVALLNGAFKLTPAQLTNLSDVVSKSLTSTSNYFTIASNASLNNSKGILSITSVVDKQGKVIYWQEN
jgi:type II secretory pathway component PulK